MLASTAHHHAVTLKVSASLIRARPLQSPIPARPLASLLCKSTHNDHQNQALTPSVHVPLGRSMRPLQFRLLHRPVRLRLLRHRLPSRRRRPLRFRRDVHGQQLGLPCRPAQDGRRLVWRFRAGAFVRCWEVHESGPAVSAEQREYESDDCVWAET